MSDTLPIHERPLLRKLAAHLGIVDAYVDQTGGEVRYTTDLTRERLLTAMHFNASTEDGAQRALRSLRKVERTRLIEPVRVVRQHSKLLSRVRVRMPRLHADVVRWTLGLRTEEGIETHWSDVTHGGEARRLTLTLPIVPPLGYHDLWIRFEGADQDRSGHQRLIVVPSRCTAPETRLHGKRGFGITTNLYTVRSESNWGAGDLGDVRLMSEWVAEHGGVFVGMSPMHALRNEGFDVSPYSPITRLFRNPLYLRVLDIPELRYTPEVRGLIESPAFQSDLAELRATTMVDYERTMRLRAPILQELHRSFHAHESRNDTRRARLYEAYVRREDPQLTQFALYMALSEVHGPDARAWPEAFRNPGTPEVAVAMTELSERVDYHRWLQFELDRQLGYAAFDSAKAGLELGIYQDLAVGSSASGSDVWSHPELFLQGATLGAPPDMYSDEGQNWGLPAIDPRVLRETGYDYWTRLLRAGFRHTGALRIDHALGLFRLFWVPLGESAKQGAYVKSRTNDLFGILALESVRHNALVVGEDLGTIPPEVPKVLSRWGVLSSKVQVFERDFHSGRYKPAAEYPRMALATVNTHDLPPLAGWLEERDIQLRSEVGDLSDPHVAERMREHRRHERGSLISSLIEAGLLPHDAHHNLSAEALVAAVHAFVRRTPSCLVGLSLDDLAYECMPVNIPGVWQDKYPSWSRRMRDTLETLFALPRTRQSLGTE